MNKNILTLIIRISISIALVSFALKEVDWSAYNSYSFNFESEYLAAGLFAVILSYVLGSIRWYFLLNTIGFNGGFFECISLYFASGLINQGVPSTLGGDTYRAIKAAKFINYDKKLIINENKIKYSKIKFSNLISVNFRISFAVVMLDRLIGLMGNNLVGAFGMIVSGYKISIRGQEIGYFLLIITLLCLVILILILYHRRSKVFLYKFLDKYRLKKIFYVLNSFSSIKIVSIHAFVSIIIHLLNVLAFGFCLKALGQEMSLNALMIGLPLISVLNMIPLSVSGWGVRELTLTAILSIWGINPAIIVLASISYGLLTLIAMLPGAYSLLSNRGVNMKESIG